MKKTDSAKDSPVKPAAKPVPAEADRDKLTMDDLDKVSGGAYTPGGSRTPVPPPSHHGE